MKKDKESIAVALEYNPDLGPPKIIAKGKGAIAEKIIEEGNNNEISLYKDNDLAQQLISIDINDEISQELYGTVAEILAFIFLLDKEKGA